MDNECGTNLSVLQAETLALRMATTKIRELNLSIVEIEGDNLCLINVLNGIWLCPWKINLFISDIFSDLIGYVDFRFVHVFREVNQAADRIAKLGFSGPQRS